MQVIDKNNTHSIRLMIQFDMTVAHFEIKDGEQIVKEFCIVEVEKPGCNLYQSYVPEKGIHFEFYHLGDYHADVLVKLNHSIKLRVEAGETGSFTHGRYTIHCDHEGFTRKI